MTGFIQLPFRKFCSIFPEYIKHFKKLGAYEDCFNDEHYVVRLDLSSGEVEVGYPSDKFRINGEPPRKTK